MLKKIAAAVLKHKLLSIIIVLLLVWAGYAAIQRNQSSNQKPQYVTSPVETSTLVVSIPGVGQVQALDQVDIKPEVSGRIVSISLKNGQEASKNSLFVSLDARDARRSVSDAEIALESARIQLDELIAGADAQDLLQAENAVAQAERDLEKAQKTYDTIESDAADTIAQAYEDGYSDVSNSFFKLSDYMEDLQDVLGTSASPEEHIKSYENILGTNSPFIEKLVDDYNESENLYDENFSFFRGVFKNDDGDTIYKLISDTITTAESISQSLESARHMYDVISTNDYSNLYIASTINTMQPQIESDLSSIFSIISSLQSTKDTIDDTVSNTPDSIKDAKLSLDSAQENLAERKQTLADLQAGADDLDIRTQKNTVAQKEAALVNAQEQLARYSVRVPFDGVVENIDVNVGDTVSSGTTLATLITKDRVAEISLNEIDVAQISLGQKATITFDALEDITMTGEVIEIDAIGTVTQGVVNYDVTIAFDLQDERIKPGMTVSVEIIANSKQSALIVPNAAIKTQGSSSYVEVLNDQGVPERRSVEIGISNDISTEIVSGLEEGEEVVTQTISGSSATTGQSTSSQGNSLLPTGRAAGGEFRQR